MEAKKRENDSAQRCADYEFAAEAGAYFMRYGTHLRDVTRLAGAVSCLIEGISPFIQRHTEMVCPTCESVCCVNRHGYHEPFDLLLLAATGRESPLYETGREDTASCQFLGEAGCRLPRSSRPYRCTWYFCAPLLASVRGSSSGAEYRRFIRDLEEITARRREMLDQYLLAVRELPSLLGREEKVLYY